MKNLLMVLGPTEVEKDILKLSSCPQDYMRTDDYSKKWSGIFENLKYVFQTKNPVVVFASSGTGAMEAAVTNTLCKNDKILYINSGSFGKRWGDICKKHSINAIEIPFEFGKAPDIETVKSFLSQHTDAKALFATLNETSSGSLTDIKSIGNLLKNYPQMLFIVDCVSGLLAEEFKQDEWGVDVVVSASQKAFALPPGLGFMSVSDKTLQYAEKSDLRTFYFDIFDYVNNAKRNQTPFTPAVSLVNMLEKRLIKIRKIGLENYRKKYLENTKYLREKLAKLDFYPIAQNPTNCVTAVYTEKYDASEIVRIMREKHHIEIAPSGGELRTKLFRVGNYGAIGKREIDRFIKALKQTLRELDNDRK